MEVRRKDGKRCDSAGKSVRLTLSPRWCAACLECVMDVVVEECTSEDKCLLCKSMQFFAVFLSMKMLSWSVSLCCEKSLQQT